MTKFLFLFIFVFTINSCGYPDVDSVPNFKDVLLTNEEINDYCSNTNSNKKNIEKCIIDYKSNNKL
tara:strand:- start:272 stop:469 length:198 start_codon:yes stop_codon:yes gene_type:complete